MRLPPRESERGIGWPTYKRLRARDERQQRANHDCDDTSRSPARRLAAAIILTHARSEAAGHFGAGPSDGAASGAAAS